MNRNVEIKARLEDPAEVRRRAAALADRGPLELEQEDTFYASPRGRLKLRRFGDGGAELIFYRRPDERGPRTSHFLRSTVEPDAMRELLDSALDTLGVVRKRRTVFFADRTRIHIDRVEGLGDFAEIEVVLAPGESESDGRRVATEVMAALAIEPRSLVERAYFDLLEEV